MTAGPWRVLVTGSRNWSSHDPLHHLLDTQHTAHPHMTLVHGACAQGADAIADRWAISRGLSADQVERHPAQWVQRGTGRRNRRAGILRNAAMVDAGAAICLAFIGDCPKRDCDRPRPHGSHGAMHTARLAAEAGIPLGGCCARCAQPGPLHLPEAAWGRVPWLLCSACRQRYAHVRTADGYVDFDDAFANADDDALVDWLAGGAT